MNETLCFEVESLLVDYADGLLAPGEAKEVGEHLASCERCRNRLDALRKSLELTRVI